MVKVIAGKIIPAISTTTSSVCGYILSQIYILMRESYEIKDLRTIFLILSFIFLLYHNQLK